MSGTTLGCDSTGKMLRKVIDSVGAGVESANATALRNYHSMQTFAASLGKRQRDMSFDNLWMSLKRNRLGEITEASLGGMEDNPLFAHGMWPNRITYMLQIGDLDSSGGLSHDEFRDYIHACIETS